MDRFDAIPLADGKLPIDIKTFPDNICRYSELWFDDGNIILKVENTVFCVHFSILAKHSNFFKELFTLPQPENEPTAYGCQLIDLSDCAKDWVALLRVIYDPFAIHTDIKNYPLDLIAAMARLGLKYEFDAFKNIAVTYLKNLLPTSLKDWDAFLQSPDFNRKNNFEILNLVLEIRLRTVLPTAHLLCIINHDLDDIFHGFFHDDGQIVNLSPEIMAVLAIAKEKLCQATTLYTYRVLPKDWYIPTTDCLTHEACDNVRKQLFEDLATSLFHDPRFGLHIHPCDPENPDWLHFCTSCSAKYNHETRAGRERVWKKLPGFFGLQKWEDLHDFVI